MLCSGPYGQTRMLNPSKDGTPLKRNGQNPWVRDPCGVRQSRRGIRRMVVPRTAGSA
jgi:hypothetical protein